MKIIVDFEILINILGPLTSMTNGTTTLYGIVSWGRKSCDMHSVFTRVSHPISLNWIRKTMKKNL